MKTTIAYLLSNIDVLIAKTRSLSRTDLMDLTLRDLFNMIGGDR